MNSECSYITYDPIETIEYKDGLIRIKNKDQELSFFANPFDTLQERISSYGTDVHHNPKLPHFQGGVAGLFGYDLGRATEHLPRIAEKNKNIPDMAVGIYTKVCAFDHSKKQAWFMIHADNESDAKEELEYMLSLSRRAANIKAPAQMSSPEPSAKMDIKWNSSHDIESYTKDVETIIEYIYAGDIFQANMSQRFETSLPCNFDSFDHYCHLRSISPSPFGGYMNLNDDIKISSSSPERFISLRSNQIETKPIKGTRPRSDDAALDEAMKAALKDSEKDNAENAMIVDLLRNDLSKVCVDYSVEVPALCAIESFANVHHLVSTVHGELRADKSPVDLLRGCFPGGSITGAPKVRAMEIIEELESKRRGPYCGAIGYIDFNGDMDMNILIRTLVYNKDTVSFHVGGGVVADSDPAAEYQETLDKASAIFRSFETYDPATQSKPVQTAKLGRKAA